jgi:uncharacterized membrane protein YgcG
MRRTSYTLLVLLIALAGMTFASIALADPAKDPAENWCYAGGAWGDGRCTVPGNAALTEWYWTCGYYRAQVAKGTFSASQIPQTCQTPIPQNAVESSTNNGAARGDGGSGGTGGDGGSGGSGGL